MRILAISRGETFSPNLVDADARILAATSEALKLRGHEVTTISESDFSEESANGIDCIINMCRHPRSLALLLELERGGMRIVNSPRGILNCAREPLTRLLAQANVPAPEAAIVATQGDEIPSVASAGPCWVKRADGQTMSSDDIIFCPTESDVAAALANMAARNIPRAIVCAHLSGDLIKFYGVESTDFFYWFYPLERGHSKFGYEKVNGASTGLSFNLDELKNICSDAAQALGIDVYGGDAVIASDGTIRIIDFNDWPSFSPCRDEAAQAIARII